MNLINFLVIGSGIAGLNFALNAAKQGNVLIITKKKAAQSSTNKAQGGIAAVLDKTDSPLKHVKDTLEAGCYHNHKKAVEFLVKHGPEAIYKLVANGVPFATDPEGELMLTREGGHSKRRIAFVGDYTGAAIEKTLLKKVKAHPQITLWEHTLAVDLIMEKNQCFGARVIRDHKLFPVLAEHTVIATGGIGQLYKVTTNPAISTGDGIAMGYLAGAAVKDLEFVQFHPTALHLKNAPPFLISEAVRGEGAYLVNSQTKRFMSRYHKLGELAPRDIVARAIFAEEKTGPVYLDVRHIPALEFKTRFPKIYQTLKKYKINPAKNLIPISPAAHYICGGLVTDFHGRVQNRQKSFIKNLFAFGEVTYTGVHGANRLASNSLLEALVFSNQILNFVGTRRCLVPPAIRQKYPTKSITPPTKSELRQLNQFKKTIQKIMWENVGIIRAEIGLKTALKKLTLIKKQFITSFDSQINEQIVELKNMLEAAILIAKAALTRKTSLGGHYRLD